MQIGTTTFTLRAPHATYETRHLSEEQRLQARIDEVTALAAKKPRKPRLQAEKWVYPKGGANMSTAAYVRAYFKLNKWSDATFFQPLSTTVSRPQGEDTHEVTE